MIVDCHSHVWESLEQLGRGTGLWGGDGGAKGSPPDATPAAHLAATEPVDKTVVLAFRSRYLEACVPNEFVAQYVRKHADRLVGFAAVDPTNPNEAIAELHRASEGLGMQGVTISPSTQDFHPASTCAMRVLAEVARLRLPLIVHQNVQASPTSKMEFARPSLLDEVGREFPDLKIIISQLGYPWTEETIVLLGKHRNVFADVSGLLRHPWHAYNALLAAYQAGVMGKLLFGSGFPYTTAAQCIEFLYSINQFCHGTNLPTIPREQLRQIVERDALGLLGVELKGPPAPRVPDTTVIQVED